MIKNDLLESDEVNSNNNQDYIINNIVLNDIFPIENLLTVKNFLENNKEKIKKTIIEYNSKKKRRILNINLRIIFHLQMKQKLIL